MTRLTAVYDACVLYPAPLRDFLMNLAATDCFRARWSDEIHDEWIGNLLQNRPDLDPGQLARTRRLMNESVLDCLVTDYEDLIPGLQLPDPGDRHVLAAAIRAQADMIVTFNERDFPAASLLPYQIVASHPDDFVMRMFDLAEVQVCRAAKSHRASLKNPQITIDEYLMNLEKQRLPRTAERLRTLAELI